MSDEILIPGFIDLHIHGAYGADVMDGTEEAVQTMTAKLPAEGTTSFLATTITMEPQAISKAIANSVSFLKSEGEAEIVGIHIEGPFINESKKGAQPLEYIMDPSFSLLTEWIKAGKGMIKQMTYAPEITQGVELTRFMQENGLIHQLVTRMQITKRW
ncbi:amidohydrolase family protein [Bacillus sp. JCM 19041]|uniref:amidohydrolase family protein n=1 Tax=Bacillus sp. JCM 19041 TaxID=1460637 RepID=UPI000A90872D